MKRGDGLFGDHLLPLRWIVRVDEGRRVGEADLPGQPSLCNLLSENAADVSSTDQTDFIEHLRPPFMPVPAYRR
jgi:hypothetical protein